MTRVTPVIVLVISFAFSVCWAGHNPAVKVAIHVKSHHAKQSCDNVPAISSCIDISTTYEGSSFDFFPVFFDVEEYRGVEYAVTWPDRAYSCAFTNCSDLVIGNIEVPGDGISHTWTECKGGPVAIPGWGWLCADSAGMVCVVAHPEGEAISVLDCNDGIDEPVGNFRAGVHGAVGDDPCGEGEDREGAPAVRIVRVIDVTDGSTIYTQPVWSTDGKKLAFSELPSFSGVYIRNADGSGPIQEITSADYSGFGPVWTSDSRGIVIRTRTGGVGQSISYVDIETGEVRVQERALHPKLPERNVYGDAVIDVDGETRILDDSTAGLEDRDNYYTDERPASRDLRLERGENDSKAWVVVEGDGTRIMDFPYGALLADMSPTRDRIAFLKGDGNLYVSHLDGSGKIDLGAGSTGWDWSPDGRRIV